MSYIVDHTGEKYGRLTLIKRIGTDKRRHPIYLCKCDCGNETTSTLTNMKFGNKQSDWGPYDPEYVELVFSYVRIPNSCDWDAEYDERINNE